MNQFKILTILVLLLGNIGLAQEQVKQNAPTLEETINIIIELGENYNYDSHGNYMSKPFKNTRANISFDKSTGILKMQNMADYSGDWGKSNFDIELNLKKINPNWIRGYTNVFHKKYSGFKIEPPSDFKDNILKEENKFVKETGVGNFIDDAGNRLANALQHACSLLYDKSNEPTLEETIDLIIELGENYNYVSYEKLMSEPFKNTKANVSFDKSTGILKMLNMADYYSQGDKGEPNFDIELNLKKIDPNWIKGYNAIFLNQSGFDVEIPSNVKGDILKEENKFVKETGIGNFKDDAGERLARALKHACSLLYENSKVIKF